MSTQTMQVLASNVMDALNIKAQAGWKIHTLVEADGANCVCLDSVLCEVGFTAVLVITDGEYSFQLQEYASHSNNEEFDDCTDFKTFDQLVAYIRLRMDLYMNGEETF
jgi:hypothetical protein